MCIHFLADMNNWKVWETVAVSGNVMIKIIQHDKTATAA